jgi:primosomal protein N'
MFEKFLGLVERIADALEVIAAAKTGNEVRTTTPPPAGDTTDTTADQAAEVLAKEQAAAKRKAARDKKAAEEKAAKEAEPATDPMDPLGDDPLAEPATKTQPPKEYTEKEVRAKLAELIDKEGRPAAFAVLKDHGGGAKAFTDLKKEKYEDVYLAIEEALA